MISDTEIPAFNENIFVTPRNKNSFAEMNPFISFRIFLYED